MKIIKIDCRFYLLIIAMIVNISCATKQLEVQSQTQNIKIEKEYVDKLRRDSIFIFDSVRVVEKADTVFYTRTRMQYRDRILRDTVFKTDTIFRHRDRIEISQTKTKKKYWWIILAAFIALIIISKGNIFQLLIKYIKKIV